LPVGVLGNVIFGEVVMYFTFHFFGEIFFVFRLK